MTPTREEMIALALASGFKDKQIDVMFYESGPYELSFPTPALEAFYRAAFAAGQAEMRERAAIAAWHRCTSAFKKPNFSTEWEASMVAVTIRALPIEGENDANQT